MSPPDVAPPSLTSANQPGRRPVTSRAQISAIAIDLFSTRGFEETSVDDVAEAVGIARRTLCSAQQISNGRIRKAQA